MSRFRDVKPHQPLPPRAPRKSASTPVSQPSPKKDTLGPRPISARQQSLREGGTPPLLPRTAVPPAPSVARPRHPAALPPLTVGQQRESSKRRKRLRDAETTRSRVRVKRAGKNRRRINVPKILLGWATAVLVVECAAALLFSPRLWVSRILVEGNRNVALPTILARLKIGDKDNIVRLPVKKLQAAVGAEPEIETAEIHRDFLRTRVRVLVKERTPWACVQTPDQVCYTIDRNLVPFRTADVPPVGLPLLKLSDESGKVPLGKPMTAPGLAQVSRCLTWARARTDFPLDAVTIDSEGKLCLNRAGGTRFLLGSGVDLDRKLKSLEMLLTQRAELRSATNVAYVNLLAYDAPAVRMRSVSDSDSAASKGAMTVDEVGTLH